MSEEEKSAKIFAKIRDIAGRILPTGSRIVLFGSRARGEARLDSDWDLHILVPGKERLTLAESDDLCWEFSKIGIFEFDEMIETYAYSTQEWAQRSFLPFYKNVERDKVIIFQN